MDASAVCGYKRSILYEQEEILISLYSHNILDRITNTLISVIIAD